MTTSPFSSQTDPEYDATQQYDTPSDIQSVEARWIAEGFPDEARLAALADEAVAQALSGTGAGATSA